MASLQANHSRTCALGRAWTPFDKARDGCTCPDGPLYYIVAREGQHAHKEVAGRDRQQAELALHRLAEAIADGRFRPRPTIGFGEWADRWLASLERKPSTVHSYRSTIVHAKDAFGSLRVRRIGAEDIAEFNGMLRKRGCSPSTRAKHLRVLGACFQAAVFYRFADSNPVRELPPAQRPRPERKEAAYFENSELPQLFAHFNSEPYRTLCLVALKTGMRQGVLLALRWSDIDLDRGVLRVERSVEETKAGLRVKPPKTKRGRRNITLPPEAVAMLRAHRKRQIELRLALGQGGQPSLVVSTIVGDLLSPDNLSRDWPRVCNAKQLPTVGFHSLRHTHVSMLIRAGVGT